MPTLANIQQSDLFKPTGAVSFQQIADIFGGTKAQRDLKAKKQGFVDTLAGEGDPLLEGEQGPIQEATEEQKQEARVRLAALDPTAAAAIRKAEERGDVIELATLKKEVDKGVRLAAIVGNAKTFQAKRQRLTEMAQDMAARGEDTTRILALRNLPEKRLNLELQRMKLLGQDTKTILTPKKRVEVQRSTEGIPQTQQTIVTDPITGEERVIGIAKPAQAEEFVDVLDAQGNVIGQRSTTSQKVIAPGETEQFIDVKDEAGNIIGQRSVRSQKTSAAGVVGKVTDVKDADGRIIGQRKPDGTIIKNPLVVDAKGDQSILNEQFKAGNITAEQYEQGTTAIREKTKTTLVRNLETGGVDLSTKAGKDLLIKVLTAPKTVIKDRVVKLSPDTVPVNPEAWDRGDFSDGVKAVKGSKADRFGVGDAAKVEMVLTAQKAVGKPGDVNGVDGLVYETFEDKNGNRVLKRDSDGNLDVDRVTLAQSFISLPNSDGQLLNVKMEMGIQAITRGETGAAMPPSEVENTRIRFMPKVSDSDEVIKLKLEMFRDFLDGSLKLIDPTGTRIPAGEGKEFIQGAFNQEAYDRELEKRTKNQGSTKVGRFNVRVK